MDFTNTFSVAAPVDDVFAFMVRAEEVAPCVPGAAITEQVDPTHYRGKVKLKLGAVQMEYRGDLEMRADRTAGTITLTGRGSDTRGGGGASGTFVTRLAASDTGGTTVTIESHVDVTGRVATFGRGIMQDVSNRMIQQFAACLEAKLQAQSAPAEAEPPSPSTDDGAAAVTSIQPQEVIHVPSPHPTPAFSAEAAAELRVGKLIADITRSRLAQALRTLAEMVEPR